MARHGFDKLLGFEPVVKKEEGLCERAGTGATQRFAPSFIFVLSIQLVGLSAGGLFAECHVTDRFGDSSQWRLKVRKSCALHSLELRRTANNTRTRNC